MWIYKAVAPQAFVAAQPYVMADTGDAHDEPEPAPVVRTPLRLPAADLAAIREGLAQLLIGTAGGALLAVILGMGFLI